MQTRRHFLNSAAATAGAATLALGGRAAEAPVPQLAFALFDTHAHLISADLVRYPRVFDSSGRPAQPGTDVQSPEADQLLAWMDATNVGGAAAVHLGGIYGFNNYYVLDSTDRFRSRLLPVVGLDAADETTPELMRRYVRERGLAALRITGGSAADGSLPWLSSPEARRSWAAADEHSLAMVIMNTPPGRMPAAIAEYIRLAREYPNVRLVLDQLAWPDANGAPDYGIDSAHQSLALLPNIHFKFSSINLQQLAKAAIPAATMLRHVVDVYGADRVMWGSDVGHSAGTYAALVREAIEATTLLSSDEQRKVLRDTGMRVFVRGGVRRA
jgi:predicted TIM-barrel fold metal-dependent hydrolase